VLVASCTASNPAPPKWRRSLAVAQTAERGAWILVELENGERIEGELLAVEQRRLWIGRGDEGIPVPREKVSYAMLVAYTADNAGLVATTILGTLSTMTHGFFLFISAPLWMLVGGISARSHSSAGYVEYIGGVHYTSRLTGLRKWARFPQGIPKGSGFDPRRPSARRTEAAPRARRGELDTPCYPNGTCNAGLICDAARDRCGRPPALGREGGRCFANGTCRDDLACVEGICGPAIQPREGGQSP